MQGKNVRENDNKTKEIHEQIQGDGCLGCDKGAKDTGRAVEGIRGKPQPNITVEAGGDKEHGEGIRRQGRREERGGREVDKEVAGEGRRADHRAGFFRGCLQAFRPDMKKKRTLVQKGRKGPSIRKQCKLLGVSINAVYYKPKGERPENEEAMKKMDRFYMEHPTAGYGPKPAGIL